jgi:hypothetical protein
MNIFVQGMRRSGTTIVFDIFWQDSGLDCYYEPLAKAQQHAEGGGSGVTGIDYFEKVRNIRELFRQQYPQLKSTDLLNYGAPRQPELEFNTDLPDYVRDYIKLMTAQSDNTMIKFTRMFNKVKVLHEIDPAAKFIHVVRDPRAVTASHMFGKKQKYKSLFPFEMVFFGLRSHRSPWSSYPFSEFLLNTQEYSHLKGCRDFMRILLIWKYIFINTYNAGKKLYGDNYYLLRHEDLQKDPENTLRMLYEHINRPLPKNVHDWAVSNVRKNKPPYAHESRRWLEAFKKLEMHEVLALAGYDDCLK